MLNLVTKLIQLGLSFFRGAGSFRRTTCHVSGSSVTRTRHPPLHLFKKSFLQCLSLTARTKGLPVGWNESSSWSGCDGFRRSRTALTFSFSLSFFARHTHFAAVVIYFCLSLDPCSGPSATLKDWDRRKKDVSTELIQLRRLQPDTTKEMNPK